MATLPFDVVTWLTASAHRAMGDDLFVNYSSPADLKDRTKRRKVSSYIGLHFRNRSRPLAKKLLKEQSGAVEEVKSEPSEPDKRLLAVSKPLLIDGSVQLPRDGHGIRTDPFATWPIEYKSSIPAAVDYFLQFYAPSHTIRPELANIEEGNKIIQAYFRHAMQSPLLFETTIALSNANLKRDIWTDHQVDPQTLHHYNLALGHLRSLIAASDTTTATSDAVLLAIVALMGVDFLRDNMSAFQAHLAGLRHLIDLRGGIDSLGWPKLLKPSIASLEILWTYVCTTPQLLPPHTAITVSPRPAASPQRLLPAPLLTNHSHTSASSLITLPPGFRALISHPTPLLSPSTVHLISLTTHYDIHLHHSPSSHTLTRHAIPIAASAAQFTSSSGTPLLNASNLAITELAMAILAREETNRVERLVCWGLLGVLFDVTRAERRAGVVRRAVRGWVQEVGRFEFETGKEGEAEMRAERDLWAWVSLNLGAAVLVGGVGGEEVKGDERVEGGDEVRTDATGEGEVGKDVTGKIGAARRLLGGEARVRCVRRVVECFARESERKGEGGLKAVRSVPEDIVTGFIWTDACREAIQRAWRVVWEEMMVERGLWVHEA